MPIKVLLLGCVFLGIFACNLETKEKPDCTITVGDACIIGDQFSLVYSRTQHTDTVMIRDEYDAIAYYIFFGNLENILDTDVCEVGSTFVANETTYVVIEAFLENECRGTSILYVQGTGSEIEVSLNRLN